jgi:hypothetical protein
LHGAYLRYEVPKALKEATMIALGISIAAITVIGVGRTVRTLFTDGQRRVPTRVYPHAFNLR